MDFNFLRLFRHLPFNDFNTIFCHLASSSPDGNLRFVWTTIENNINSMSRLQSCIEHLRLIAVSTWGFKVSLPSAFVQLDLPNSSSLKKTDSSCKANFAGSFKWQLSTWWNCDKAASCSEGSSTITCFPFTPASPQHTVSGPVHCSLCFCPMSFVQVCVYWFL